MFYPMFVMVLLTWVIAVVLIIRRVRAVKNRQLNLGYFRLNRGEQTPPPEVVATANHFSNLFEVPVLFYVAGVLALVWNFQPPLLVALAWIFVIARVAHAFIHITYNKLMHRTLAFGISFLSVLLIWLLLAVQLASRQGL